MKRSLAYFWKRLIRNVSLEDIYGKKMQLSALNKIKKIGLQEKVSDPKIFCLITFSRSGSNLFHSLLDSHPQVICFPRALQFNEFWKVVKDRNDDPGYLVNSFITTHPHFFSSKGWIKYDRADQLGPARNEAFSIDVKLFRRYAVSELSDGGLTRKELFLGLHRAYHAACGRKFPKEAIILYHIHYIDYVDEVRASLADFPHDIYALAMTRHPVDELNACTSVMKWRDTFFCGELFNRHKQIVRGILHITGEFPGLDIRYLPFEYLLRYHRDVMRAFVNWVGIEWHDSLMASTMHGKLWWGNGQVPRNGISPGWKVYEPAGILEKKDWAIFRTLLFRRMKKLGYIDRPEYETKIAKSHLLLLLCLPTTQEWQTLKSMFSLSYWISLVKKIKEDKDGLYPSEKKQLVICIGRLNPFVWFYYLLKRIFYYYRFAVRNSGESEKVHVLLEGIPVRDERI